MAPRVEPRYSSYACAPATVVHCIGRVMFTLVAPFTGEVRVATTDAVVKLLSLERQSPPTSVQIRANTIWLPGKTRRQVRGLLDLTGVDEVVGTEGRADVEVVCLGVEHGRPLDRLRHVGVRGSVSRIRELRRERLGASIGMKNANKESNDRA